MGRGPPEVANFSLKMAALGGLFCATFSVVCEHRSAQQKKDRATIAPQPSGMESALKYRIKEASMQQNR